MEVGEPHSGLREHAHDSFDGHPDMVLCRNDDGSDRLQGGPEPSRDHALMAGRYRDLLGADHPAGGSAPGLQRRAQHKVCILCDIHEPRAGGWQLVKRSHWGEMGTAGEVMDRACRTCWLTKRDAVGGAARALSQAAARSAPLRIVGGPSQGLLQTHGPTKDALISVARATDIYPSTGAVGGGRLDAGSRVQLVMPTFPSWRSNVRPASSTLPSSHQQRKAPNKIETWVAAVGRLPGGVAAGSGRGSGAGRGLRPGPYGAGREHQGREQEDVTSPAHFIQGSKEHRSWLLKRQVVEERNARLRKRRTMSYVP